MKSVIIIPSFRLLISNPVTLSVNSELPLYCRLLQPLTEQVGINEHIYLQPGVLQYINHSCSPNIFFDLVTFKAICLRAIKKGDELFYFYPSTEWKMAEPFQCLCGSANCLGRIAGASYLSKDVIHKYRFSDFISQQLNNKYSK